MTICLLHGIIERWKAMGQEVKQQESIVIECKNCSNKIKVDAQKINYDKEYVGADGKSIYITSIVCDSCGTAHHVQLDDSTTIKLKKYVQGMFKKFAQMKTSGKTIPNKQLDKFNKTRETISKMRFELITQYDGTTVTDTLTGEEVVVNFVTVG